MERNDGGRKVNTLIIYKSKTGFTKRYATWIAEELHADLIPFQKKEKVSLSSYDTIIFGGGFYAGKINGLGWLKKHLPVLSGKKVVVFATGATPSESDQAKKALAQNVTEQERNQIKLFYFQSGLCYEKMSVMDRWMMKMFRSMLKKTQGQEEAYRMIQSSFDVCSKAAIQPLVEECR